MPNASIVPQSLMPADEFGPSLVVGRKGSAHLSEVGVATWDRKVAAGLTPRPIKFGGRLLWRRADLEKWVQLGCPSRAEFEALTAGDEKPSTKPTSSKAISPKAVKRIRT